MNSTALIGNRTSNVLGENKAKYDKYHYHIGIATTKKVRNISQANNINFSEKVLCDSRKDYQTDEKRQNLTVRSGFDRKTFCFFLEDTYMTIYNYLVIYEKPYNRPIEELVEKNALTKIYGCAYYTKTQYRSKFFVDS